MGYNTPVNQNFIVTNTENQNDASTKAQELSGTVLVLGTSIIGDLTESSDNGITGVSIWMLKIAESYTNDENNSSTYSDSGVENDLLRTGVAFSSDCLPIGIYAVMLPAFIKNQEKTVLSYVVSVLRKYDNFAVAVINDDSINGSKTACEEYP